MNAEDQPTIPTAAPNGSRPASIGWQAPSVEEMQAMLPQYEVMEVLGRGGMGAVYKGRQKSLRRLVAIKMLPLGLADDEFKFAERFQNEAQTMAAMNHPAIVSVYDFGETPDGLLYFIMEFVDGTDVQKMIQASGRLTGEYALAITAHVCDALSYAHKRGVTHRDIKPANILIDQEGRIKVADFGLAKMHDPAQTSGLTRTGTAMGTPDYVAPEVLSPGMVADHRADIYAVGVMLYQMLTGEVPRGMFKLPSQKGIGSDPRFDEIICKAMEHDREERYQSAMDVRQALDVILTTPQAKNDGTGAVSAPQIPQKTAPQQAPVQRAAAPKVKAPPKKQSPATMWMSIGGIVAVLGVAGFFVLGGKPKPQPSAPSDNASVATTASAPARSKSIDLLPLVDVKRDAIVDEWVMTPEGLAKPAVNNPPGKDAPTLQLPYQPPAEYDFEVEFTAKGGRGAIGQIISTQSQVFSWLLSSGAANSPTMGFEMYDGKTTSTESAVSKPLGKPLENGKRYRSLVEVRTGSLRAYLDGQLAIDWSGDWTRFGRATALRDRDSIGLRTARPVVFHKIEVREISGAGKMDAGTPNSQTPPPIKAWRDVTAEARETAKTNPSLVVTEKGIEKQGNAANPRLLITPPGQRDQAVRMRYTGYGQVDLHGSDRGFLYVMAQPHQTIFHSQASGSSAPPVKLIPNKLHPPGFDPKQPHELLVTIEGTRLRAWVDGRFAGEAKADTYTEGVTGLIITPETIVHQVELGEFR